jgi:hypothetical protein
MNSTDYKQALDQARHDLAHAIQQRDFWNLQIVRAQNAVRSMAVMVDAAEKMEELNREMQTQIGISQAIEALVNGAPQTVTPLEIRQGLLFYGYNIDRYANPVSLIQQTLQRLAAAGKIHLYPDGKYGRTAFYNALLNTTR